MSPLSSSKPQPTVAILGAGALGLLYGAYLSRVCDTFFIDNRVKKPAAHSSNLDIKQILPDGSESSCRLSRISTSDSIIDYLLVCTKSYDAEQAIETIESQLNEKTILVLLQNGMGFQQSIADKYPQHEIIIASTTEGANKPDNATLVHAAKGKTTLGHLRMPANETGIDTFKTLLTNADFDTCIDKNIKTVLWRKLIINCGINPYTALFNCPNGEILHRDYFQRTLPELSRELSQIAKLDNVEFSPAECEEMITSIASSTRKNISSMLQDVRNKRRTEIQAMNGYILKIAHDAGLSCPVNETLVDKIRALEKTLTP